DSKSEFKTTKAAFSSRFCRFIPYIYSRIQSVLLYAWQQYQILFRIVSPLHIHGTPGEASTEGCQYQVIAFLELVFILPQTERNSTARCVTIALNVEHHFIAAYAHAVGSSVDNTFIGLMQ